MMRYHVPTNRIAEPATKTSSPGQITTARACLSRIASSQRAGKTDQETPNTFQRIALFLGGSVLGTLALHSKIGTEENYYEYRFTTDKHPDDLAGFYGSEEFMDLFCVVPFVGTVMMRGGEFDDEGGFHTTGMPGTLKVNMVFSDELDPATGETVWFNKRERFKDTLFQRTLWDTVMNFGFRKLPDGKIECYHAGEYFKGSAPPISLVVKLMFQVHARWVAWATEHHLNNHAFTACNHNEAAIEECSRKDMPLHLLRDHLVQDLKSMLLNNNTSKSQGEDRPRDGTQLPPQPQIPMNQTTMNQTLSTDFEFEDIKTRGFPSDTRNRSIKDKSIDENPTAKPSFLIARDKPAIGSVSYDIPITDQLPKDKIQSDIELDKKMQSSVRLNDDDFGYRNLGGNQAWELVRSTSDPMVYQKVTQAAIQRHQTRRAKQHPGGAPQGSDTIQPSTK